MFATTSTQAVFDRDHDHSSHDKSADLATYKGCIGSINVHSKGAPSAKLDGVASSCKNSSTLVSYLPLHPVTYKFLDLQHLAARHIVR
jgi:hypothetical protein